MNVTRESESEDMESVNLSFAEFNNLQPSSCTETDKENSERHFLVRLAV